MASVFIVGAAAVDFVLSVDEFPTRAEKYRADNAVIVGGGCAANAAVAIARLGGDALLATRLGMDTVGDLILSDLKAEGVQTEFVNRAPDAQSSFSSIFLDRRGERQIVNFRGRGLTKDTDWIAEAPDVQAILVDTRWRDGAIAGLQLARERRIPGIVDAEAPIDPAILAQASHIAFSRQGLRSLTADPDPARALKEIDSRLGGWISVTDGENGVYFTDGGQIGHIPAFAIEVRDTLAAGDIWHGAFALRLAEGADEATAIRFANAAAALKCTRLGGRAGCPDRAEVADFLKERESCS